jgi:hypothetical protein
MTKKDLFRLIIKIFGLYAVISTLFSALPGNISFVIMQLEISTIIWLLITLLVIISLFIFLIYKPDRIIGWLQLDKGFDDDRIDFHNFNDNSILKLAVILIGGFLFIQNIPVFLSNTLFAFKSTVSSEFYTNDSNSFGDLKDYIHWATSFLNLVIGYLLVTNYNYISRLLKQKDDKSDTFDIADKS